MSTHYYFGAGPAMLPEVILREAQAELLDWQGQGISILELGHRTPEFMDLLSQAELRLRRLLAIPDNYQVLFLGGAARTQFAMIPLNCLNKEEKGAYLLTGVWSALALEEAKKLKRAYCAASEAEKNYLSIPAQGAWSFEDDTAYLYYTPNETVNGVRFPYVPKTSGLPLIADMTSCLLSEPIDIRQYALIFAGAQKNIANAGLTLVIIRDDMLGKADQTLPSMLDYKLQVTHHSLYATPPVFNCYLAAKMFAWVEAQGGIERLFHNNCVKAATLYQYLDANPYYQTSVDPEARSLMNVCFSLKNPQLEAAFLQAAKARGLTGLKGHRLVGGLRASLYNAMPLDGVEVLIEFMSTFAKEHQL